MKFKIKVKVKAPAPTQELSKIEVDLLKKLLIKKTTLQILLNFKVENNILQYTTLDQSLEIKGVDMPDGIYDLAKYLETSDLEYSKQDIDKAEFPLFLEMNDTFETTTQGVGQLLKLLSLQASYTSNDYSRRIVLTGSYIDPANNVLVSTTGHILREDELCLGLKEGYILPSSNVYPVLNKLENLTFRADSEKHEFKTQDGRVMYQAKNIESPYPEYKKLIPDYDKMGYKELEDVPGAIALIKKMLPYTNRRTKQIRFDENEITADNGEGKIKTLPYFENPFFRAVKNPVGFNAAYLLLILKQIEKGVIPQLYSNSPLGAFLIKTENTSFIILPLRLLDEEE